MRRARLQVLACLGGVLASLVVPGASQAAVAASASALAEPSVLAGGGNGYGGSGSAVYLGTDVDLASSAAGDLYIADHVSHVVRIVQGTNTTAVVGGTFAMPMDVGVDDAGNVYVAETAYVKKITPGGAITTIAGNGAAPTAAGGVAATSVGVRPTEIAVAPDGRVVIGEGTQIREIGIDGVLRRLAGTYGTASYAGDGGPGSLALFRSVDELALGPDGAVLVADTADNRLRRIAPDANHTVTTIMGTGAAGGFGGNVPATEYALDSPTGIAVEADGDVVVVERSEGKVLRFPVGGNVSTVFVSPRCRYGMALRGDAVVLLCDGAPDATAASPVSAAIYDFGSSPATRLAGATSLASPDGVPASQARLGDVSGSVRAADGTLYISSRTTSVVRRVGVDGILGTVAGSPDSSAPLGDGGPATAAHLVAPGRLALGPDGSLYVADPGANRVRRVSADGIITTVAGNGGTTYTGDGADATAVGLDSPSGVAVDGAGTVYVADTGHDALRAISPGGSISTLATFEAPSDLAIDGDGVLVLHADGLARVSGATVEAVLSQAGLWASGVAQTPGGRYVGINSAVYQLAPDGAGTALRAGLRGVQQLGAGPTGTILLATRGDAPAGGQVLTLPDASLSLRSTPPIDVHITAGAGRIAVEWKVDGEWRLAMRPGTVPPANIYQGREPFGHYPVSNSDGASATFTILGETNATPLVAGQSYAISLFRREYVSIGPNSVAEQWSAPVSAVVVPTADTTPPGPVTGAQLSEHQTYLWLRLGTPPADVDYARTAVRYHEGTVPPATPTDGLSAPEGNSLTFFDLAVGTTYSFSIFTIDAAGNYGPPVTFSGRRDTIGPAAVTDLRIVATTSTSATFAWTAAQDADYAGILLVVKPGLEAPTGPTDGHAVNAGSGTLYVDQLAATQPHTATVWSRDANGNFGGATSITFVPKATPTVTLTAATASVVHGGTVKLTAKLMNAGSPVANQAVQLFVRRKGTVPWTKLADATTGATGSTPAFAFTPQWHAEVRAALAQTATYAAAESAVGRISVATKVTAALSRPAALNGTTVTIRGVVGPAHSGSVTLQRYSGTTWLSVANAALTSTSSYTFSVRPTTTGLHRYRVIRSADADHAAGTSPTLTYTAYRVAIASIHRDAAGVDNSNLRDEYVILKNTGTVTVNLSSWLIDAGSSTQRFRLPAYSLAPGKTVRVATGTGTNAPGVLYLRRTTEIWANTHDVGSLYDPGLALSSRLAY